MTCIIGLVENGKVYMSCDSLSSDGYDRNVVARTKVFSKDSFLIGCTGSIRMSQLLQYNLTIPEQKEESNMAFMVCTVVEAIREQFKTAGFTKIENNREDGGTFLMGYKNQVYTIQDDFAVLQYERNFHACGAGAERALVIMRALEHLPPRERILKTLEIVTEFSSLVTPPFHILELDSD